jgi:hypothetical protein
MTYLVSMQEFASCLASHASSALPARVSFVAEGHDRMPVLLKPEQFDHWPSGNMTVDELKPIENDLSLLKTRFGRIDGAARQG